MRYLAAVLALCLAATAHAGAVERTCRRDAKRQCRAGAPLLATTCPTARIVEATVGIVAANQYAVAANVDPCAGTVAVTVRQTVGTFHLCGFHLVAGDVSIGGSPCAVGESPPFADQFCYDNPVLDEFDCYMAGDGVTAVLHAFPPAVDLTAAFTLGVEHYEVLIPPAPPAP